MKLHIVLACLFVSACATPPSGPVVDSPYPIALSGSAVALNRPVRVGDLVVTPIRVIEDSRCPSGAQCIWAGRLTIEARIDGAGWRQTDRLALGEPHAIRDASLVLASVTPEAATDRTIDPAAYRFVFELR